MGHRGLNQRNQQIEEMGDDTCTQTGDGVCAQGLGNDLAVAQGVQHSGVSGEETAPAHTDGGEDGDGVTVQDTGGIEGGKKAQGGSHGAKGRHREGDEFHILETEQPFEHPVNLLCQPGQDGNAL